MPPTDHPKPDQSTTDQYWQYAKEATLSAAIAKTADDRQALLELARTWTQAALQERSSSAGLVSGLKPLPQHIITLIERHCEITLIERHCERPRTSQTQSSQAVAISQSCGDPFEHPRFATPEESHAY